EIIADELMEARPKPGRKSSPRRARDAGPRGGKSVSLRDVARMAKVSVATVSMVLNDNPRISRATHLRVQRLIDRLGYRPNRLPQSLSGRDTQAVAVLRAGRAPSLADP